VPFIIWLILVVRDNPLIFCQNRTNNLHLVHQQAPQNPPAIENGESGEGASDTNNEEKIEKEKDIVESSEVNKEEAPSEPASQEDENQQTKTTTTESNDAEPPAIKTEEEVPEEAPSNQPPEQPINEAQ